MKISRLRELALAGLCVSVVSANASEIYDNEYEGGEASDTSCRVSAWADSKCENGQQVRTRNVIRDHRGRGMPCPSLEQTILCEPIHCDVSEWTAFLPCDESGFKARTREVLVEPAYGGLSCPRLEDRVRYRLGDCEVCQWSDWTCDPETGNQTRYRHVVVPPNDLGSPSHILWKRSPATPSAASSTTPRAQVIQEPKYDGKPCAEREEIRTCLVNCEVSDFDDWTVCDPTTGFQNRSRTVKISDRNGGEKCPPLVEEQNCLVSCVMSAFGGWSGCDPKSGTRTRSRTVDVQPLNGGEECPNTEEEEECAVDCVVKYKEWSSSWYYAEVVSSCKPT